MRSRRAPIDISLLDISFLIFLLAVAVCFTACQQSQPSGTVGPRPLPPPPTGDVKFAGAPPAHPYAKAEGNYFARTAFETDGPADSHIEIRDVLIPPHGKSEVAELAGAAIAELESGNATVSSGDRHDALAPGAQRALASGRTLQFENPDARPAVVRLYIIRER